ncbi:MAG TPA: MarR family transcriptional regulator [Candidatus Cryosericum sp.]|nr:MarR family transcriptional regulator [Candidatus Cryosericum sp.]
MDVHSLSKRMMLLQMLRRRNMHNSCFTKEIVPGQYPLLNYLSGNPEATQQELATVLFVSPASVAQSTKRLQKAGLLEKESDPKNLRKNRLRVTAAGQEAVVSFRQVINALDQRIFSGFSEAETESLSSMMERMIVNLATEEDLVLLHSIETQNASPKVLLANADCKNGAHSHRRKANDAAKPEEP